MKIWGLGVSLAILSLREAIPGNTWTIDKYITQRARHNCSK